VAFNTPHRSGRAQGLGAGRRQRPARAPRIWAPIPGRFQGAGSKGRARAATGEGL